MIGEQSLEEFRLICCVGWIGYRRNHSQHDIVSSLLTSMFPCCYLTTYRFLNLIYSYVECIALGKFSMKGLLSGQLATFLC